MKLLLSNQQKDQKEDKATNECCSDQLLLFDLPPMTQLCAETGFPNLRN